MVIPYERLSAAALRGLIEEVVTRDGTDLEDADPKIEQVLRQLRQGALVIVFDEASQSCGIMPAGQAH